MARILIVDNDREATRILSKAVQVFGHEALCVHGGQEALDLLTDTQPDAVLLDVMMPGLDGYETLRRLRALPGADGLPVLMVTAGQDRDLEVRMTQAGALGVLHKPVDLDQLAGWLEALPQPV
jgi:DNA-binding response OmpR family regulator